MKTSLHCQKMPSWVRPQLEAAGATWLKIVNPGAGPRPFAGNICIRQWTDDIDAHYLSQGEFGGAQFVRDVLYPLWQRCPWATCIETANEPDCNSNGGLERLRLYSLGAMRQAEALNMPPLCILNLPEGNPGGDDAAVRWKLAQLAEAVRWAADHGHYVGLHAYWRPGVEGPTGRYHALGRVAWTVEQWAGMGVDLSRLKVLVNECGIDGGIAGHPPKQGWRTLSNATTYAAQIVELERAARQYPWLEACLLFTAGYESPWGDFDVDEALWQRVVGGIAALPAPLPRGEIPAMVKAPGVSYRAAPNAAGIYQSARVPLPGQEGTLWLVIHGTDGPRDAALAWWASPGNSYRSSAHDLVDREGVVWRCVPYDRAAHHCGGSTIPGVPAGSTNGVSNVNHATIGIELECRCAPSAPGYTAVQLAAAVKHVRSIVKALGIPRERVVRHAEIDPDNRSDPRELAWQALLDDIYEVAPMLDTAAFGDWMQQHVIPQNPAAAFYAYGRAQGWEPISGEHDWQGYRAQVWYSPADQKQHIVYARIGDWGNVKHFDR